MRKSDAENFEQEKQHKSVPSILAKRKLLPGDRVLWVIVVMLFAISLVAVYTASSQLGLREGTISTEFQRHAATIGMSIAILIACYLMGAIFLRKVSLLAFVTACIMTTLPYFLGEATNDAHRWLNLGFIKFQPSELLKIGTIMLLAAQLSARHHRANTIRLLPTTFDVRKWTTPKELDIIKNDILPIVAPIAISCIVILPAHTSSAVHIFIVSIVLLFIAGIRLKEIFKLIIVSAVIGVALLFIVGRGGVVVDRMKSWVGIENQEKNEDKKSKEENGAKDTYYSKMAIQNGGLFGVGAGRSMMRAKLIHPESDYLFAIIVEEFGLLLAFVIVLLYLWLFFRSLRIFEQCEWLFAGLLAVGLALLITTQGFIHIGVTLGLLPETGQNLPFITHGRTGMFCASIAVGLILSISRQVEQGTLLPPSQKGSKRI